MREIETSVLWSGVRRQLCHAVSLREKRQVFPGAELMPKVAVKVDWRLLAVAGVILTGYFFVLKKGVGAVGDAAAAVGGALDPTSPDNLAAASVAALGEAITGEEGWTPGAAVYDWGHVVEVDPETGLETIEANLLGTVADWVTGV